MKNITHYSYFSDAKSLLGSTLLLISTRLFIGAQQVRAQNPLGNTDNLDIPKVEASSDNLDKIITLLFVAAGGLSVIFVVIGGVMYIFSAGNADLAKRARSIIIYALIGLAVSILAYAIVNLIAGLATGEEVKTL